MQGRLLNSRMDDKINATWEQKDKTLITLVVIHRYLTPKKITLVTTYSLPNQFHFFSWLCAGYQNSVMLQATPDQQAIGSYNQKFRLFKYSPTTMESEEIVEQEETHAVRPGGTRLQVLHESVAGSQALNSMHPKGKWITGSWTSTHLQMKAHPAQQRVAWSDYVRSRHPEQMGRQS